MKNTRITVIFEKTKKRHLKKNLDQSQNFQWSRFKLCCWLFTGSVIYVIRLSENKAFVLPVNMFFKRMELWKSWLALIYTTGDTTIWFMCMVPCQRDKAFWGHWLFKWEGNLVLTHEWNVGGVWAFASEPWCCSEL